MVTGNSNPLRRAVDRAGGNSDYFANVFRDAGIGAVGRGVIGSLYRQTRADVLLSVDERRYNLAQVNRIGKDLARNVRDYSRGLLENMVNAGEEEAAEQLALYGFDAVAATRSEKNEMIGGSLDYLITNVEAQAARMSTFALQGTPVDEIIGDQNHVGILRDSDILADLAALLIELFFYGFFGSAYRSGDGVTQISKIAVAAIDRRTTQCCLHVHGQVVPLEKPFRTTYPPAWSDEQDAPPFHYYCRTAIALYLPQFDDGLSTQMKDYASAVLTDPSHIRYPVSGLSG